MHCAASINDLRTMQYLVEKGACLFSTTFNDQETAAEKCDETEENYEACLHFLYEQEEKLGVINNGEVRKTLF